MPYLGNEPGAITDAFTDTFTGDGSETAFTLTQASTTNSVFVRIHGVMQRNGTDFTVDGTTLTFTTAPPNASNNVVVQFFTIGSVQAVADNAITQAKMADNAIGLAELAGGTDGNIISFDSSGDPVAIATGNDGQVLTSAGAGAQPAFEALPAASSGWEFISHTVFSSTANFTATVGADYDYQAIFRDVLPATDAQLLVCNVGVAGPTYRTSGYQVQGVYIPQTTSLGGFVDTAGFFMGSDVQGNAAAEQGYMTMTIFDPAGAGYTACEFQSNYVNNGGVSYANSGAGRYDTAESNTLLKWYYGSGNIASGNMSFYKRAIS